ncbi:hypothetical protein [uncultured Thiodictyon sp.]|uniref:hypothetical protein n=1 Tax=uncultured Thiodictyon sp. TaxID=1846217 RepID=UPI0025DFD62D|nr:hypothetical protein [uncultured Thiodictyon sp.]
MQSAVAIAIGDFLRVFHTESASDEGLAHLIEVLDRLAWLAHGVKYEFDERDYPEPTPFDRRTSLVIADQWLRGMRQPDEKSTFMATDAIMDLSEIVDDMTEISWRFQNTSSADALFHYQLGFYSHWGHHLRSLQKSIHNWYW